MTEKFSSLGLPEVRAGIDVGVPVVRNYKDSVFRMLFRDKDNLLSLYNALNGTNYEDPDELEINTLENAIYLGRKNDISFVIHSELHLYEHQSTVNPNMPLRSLLYLSAIYERMTAGRDLHTSRRLELPLPSCVVFYNGTKKQPDRMWMKLSDLYSRQKEAIQYERGLELIVEVININRGYYKALMEDCETLWGYGIYVDKVRQYRRTMSLEQAVERAVSECISEGILADFLRQNRAEVKSMSIFEYNEEEHIRQVELDAMEMGMKRGMEQGLHKGKMEAILELLADLGTVSDALKARIRAQENPERLSKWLKLAAKAQTLEAFEQQMD